MPAPRLLAVAALAAAATLPALPAEAWTLTSLYSFHGGTDGFQPTAGLLYQNGTLYGTTYFGGTGTCSIPNFAGCGTVFAVNATTGAETVVYSFKSGADGAGPVAGVIHHAGILYGTTSGGGASGLGTAFRLNPQTGTETVLYSFAGGTDGSEPLAGLTYLNGALYGTTGAGGGTSCSLGCGTVFAVNATTGAETVLHSFTGLDGQTPRAALIYQNGLFYGTTVQGGGSNNGTVFELDATTGAETVLHSFKGGLHDGATPEAGLVYHGYLYGTTTYGGHNGLGMVFRVNPQTGAEKVLHSFFGLHIDGRAPVAGLIYLHGTLYGTTQEGGTKGKGTVFAINVATGTETVLHSFTGPDGYGPSGLIYQGGAFYGIAEGGDKACLGGCGTVFKFAP